ncbi:UDP-N-acetyl-D-mannosamine dehydrogenase [Devosia beringensis]|uniref:UDP-N-acetyl-D-mannosamine dehydrogenase n=1 Tax=Devosia beringensis TaxID=2657486 RepID=UPI00186BA1F2|nr:UDP-N-acetyl-D-mannosamine dehydrogenase [Devosia beringensis]
MNSEKLKITVVGLGYIGLPTAAMLASVGHDVVGVDVNPSVVDTVNRGEIHIVERDLDQLVQAVVSQGKLRASLTPEQSDAYIIAVPTPFKNDHEPDTSYVESAARAIAPMLQPGALVILESTSPVGTTEQVAALLVTLRPDLSFPKQGTTGADIQVAYCPERVLPGRIMTELVDNDRVIGGITPVCAERARSLYQTFVRGECVLTDARSAEMTKLTENAFRDLNIGFANELSLICDRLGINVWELIALANRHPRVNILNPGPGVGGHCIAVDPWFIVHAAPEEARLIRTARQVNDGKPHWIVDKVLDALSKAEGQTVACLGLAFKADVDDLRESPALAIVEILAQRAPSAKLLVAEPFIDHLPRTLVGKAELAPAEEAIERADIVVMLVDHKTFKSLDRSRLADKTIIDTRGVWR